MDEEFLDYQSKIKELEEENSALKEQLNRYETIEKESERKLKAALESMSDAVFISDKEGNFIDFNEAFATFHKFKNKEECAKTLREYPVFLDVYFPNGELASLDQWVVPRALRGESGVNKEFTLVRKDSNEKWTGSYNYGPIKNSDGAIIGSVVTARDITEQNKAEQKLKESEEKHRRLIDGLPDIVYIYNMKSGAKFWSNQIEKVQGLEADKIHEDPNVWENSIHKDDIELVKETVSNLNEGDTFDIEYRIYDSSGNIHWFRDRGFSIKNINNELVIEGVASDITDRKKADKEIEKQKRLLKDAEKISNIGSWEWDAENDIAYWSDGLFKIFKRSPKEGAPILADQSGFYEKESYERLVKAVEECVAKGTPYEVEVQAICSDGEIRTCISRGRADKGKRGEINRLWGTFDDITEQKKVEQELKESKTKFKNLVERSPLAIYMASGVEEIAEYINQTFVEMFGYTMKEVPKVAEWWPRAYPDENYRAQIIEEWKDKIKRAIDTESQIEPLETYVTCKDGSQKYIKWGYISTSDQNWAFGIDLTARKKAEQALKESEERFKGAFNTAAHGMAIVRIDGHFIQINQSFCDIVGYTKDEMLALDFQQITHPDDLDIVEEQVRKLLSNEIKSYQLEKRYFHKNGHIVWVILSVSLVKDIENKPLHFVSQAIDITKRKKAENLLEQNEKKIKEQNEQLINSNNTKDKFFSIISHDLRGPISGIMNISEEFVKNYDQFSISEMYEFVKVISSSSSNLYKLLENLLQWSKVNQGKIEYIPTMTSLRDFAEEVEILLTDNLKNKQIKFENNISNEINAYFDIDMTQLIFRNLISNSIKFTKSGGIIEVNAQIVSEDHVQIEISDNGIGIPKSKLNELFKPDRVNSSRGTDGETGTGLGLILCKEFIEKHGGQIWVESEVGKGSKFKFTMPLRKDQ